MTWRQLIIIDQFLSNKRPLFLVSFIFFDGPCFVFVLILSDTSKLQAQVLSFFLDSQLGLFLSPFFLSLLIIHELLFGLQSFLNLRQSFLLIIFFYFVVEVLFLLCLQFLFQLKFVVLLLLFLKLDNFSDLFLLFVGLHLFLQSLLTHLKFEVAFLRHENFSLLPVQFQLDQFISGPDVGSPLLQLVK